MGHRNRHTPKSLPTAKLANTCVIFALAILSLATLANSMAKPIARDEQMYCTGAVLLAQGKMIYRDFSYVAQMPYHAQLCAVLFRIFDTTHYLLVSRLVSCVCDILVIMCIVGIFRHVLRPFKTTGMLFGLAAVVLYVFNPLVGYANGFAWNHDVIILCVVLSFWLFISTDFQQSSKYWRLAAIGALLTLATFMRITTVLAELLFFAIVLSLPAESIRQRCKTVLPFVIAAAIASIWPLWIIAQAPRAFFLNTFKMPMLNSQWLNTIGMAYNKLGLTLACLATPGYFMLIVLTVYFCLMIVCLHRKLVIANTRNLLLAALLPAAFFAVAFMPPTMWRQYLAVPVPFLVISFSYPLLYLRKLTAKADFSKAFAVAAVLTAVCSLVTIYSYPAAWRRLPIALAPERWTPIELHTFSQDVAERTKEPKLVLTLAPLLALEGGCSIYTELSCGAFAYRVADSLSPSDRQIAHTVGPQTLAALIQESPPSAAIVGVEMKALEEPILESAVKPNWEKKLYENGPTVYFRP